MKYKNRFKDVLFSLMLCMASTAMAASDKAYTFRIYQPGTAKLVPASTFWTVEPSSVTILKSGLTLNRFTFQSTGSFSIKNITSAPLKGPFRVVLINLTQGVTLRNMEGTRDNMPYVTANVASLAPGATATATLVFYNPSLKGFTYNWSIYGGTFNN